MSLTSQLLGDIKDEISDILSDNNAEIVIVEVWTGVRSPTRKEIHLRIGSETIELTKYKVEGE